MSSSETTINAKVSVTGISDLEKANTLLEQLKANARGVGEGGGSTSFVTKMNADIDKATINAEKLRATMKTATESGSSSGVTRMSEQLNRSVSASERLNSSMRQAHSSTQSMSDAGAKLSDYQSKAANSAQKIAQYQNEAAHAQSNGVSSASQFASSTEKAESSWSKIKGSIKETFSMFSVGMMGAMAVQATANGIKKAVSMGYEGIKERQSGEAMWKTSVADAHSNLDKAGIAKGASSMNRAMLVTAIQAGNSFKEANSLGKQVYSSSAGEYSGNQKKTQSLVSGLFNVQDSNMLDTREMQQLKTAVGNIGDTGQMSGTIAKSLNLLDGKMGEWIRKQYKQDHGKELGKTKTGSWSWKDVSAETAYRGLDAYGHSTGVGNASKNANATLEGMTRAGREFVKNTMASTGILLAGKLNKAFGGKGGLIPKLAGFFTDDKNFDKIAQTASSKLAGLANTIGKVGKAAYGIGKDFAPYVKSLSGGFGKGFVSEIKIIGNGIKDAYNKVKDLGGKVSGMFPPDKLKGAGEAAGKITAVLVALRGFGKLPKMGGVVEKMISPFTKVMEKIPLIGKPLSKLIQTITGAHPKQETAATKMNTAADKMNAAADKMNARSSVSSSYASEFELPDRATRNKDGSITTRKQYRNGKYSRGMSAWGSQLVEKGEGLIASGAGRHGKASLLTRLRGGALTKIGGLTKAIGGSKFAGLLSHAGVGLGKAGGLLKGISKRGGGALNAVFAGIDVMGALQSTKRGSNMRHSQIGGAVGGGLGATIGGAFLGPAGMIVGDYLGSKAGNWVGKNWNGGTKKVGDWWAGTKKSVSGFFKSGGASKTMSKAGGLMSMIPGMGLLGKGMKALATPQKSLEKFKSLFSGLTKNSKNAGKESKATAKATDQIAKSAKSASKESQNMAKHSKTAAKELSKAGKGKNGGFKGLFSGLSKSITNAFKPAKKTADAESKKISKTVTKNLKSSNKNSKVSFKGVVSSIKSGLAKAVSAAKSGSNKVGSSTKSGFNKANSSAKSSMSKMNSTVSSGFNKMQSSANKSTSAVAKSMDKVGAAATDAASKVKTLQAAISSLKSKTITLKVNVTGKGADKLATGTPGAPANLAGGWSGNGGVGGGIYNVNDGNGHWREGFKLPNGLMGLFPNKRNYKAFLMPGTQVFNGSDTKRLFGGNLAKGTPGARAGRVGGAGAPVINITVNVNGNGANGSDGARGGNANAQANNIANAIGEKLINIWPSLAI